MKLNWGNALDRLPRPTAAVALLVLMCRIAAAAGGDDYVSFKRDALAALQPKYAAIVAAYPKDPGLVELQHRLELIDKVVGLLSGRLLSSGTASLDTMLATGLEKKAVRAPKNTMSAAEILVEYDAEFATGLSRPQVKEEELKVLLEYYGAAVKAAEGYIAKRGRVMGMMDEKLAADAVQLSMVLPLLHVPDQNWSITQINSLPDWLRLPKALPVIEGFALSVKRPLAAYQFALLQKTAVDKAGRTLPPIDYLRASAGKLAGVSEYHAAIHCLKVAVDLADAAGRAEDAVALHLQRAEILSNIGHPKLAAEEAKSLLSKYPESQSFGRAAMLRLKYLYEAEQLPPIAEEAPKYAGDRRAVTHLPQILYIQWQALRRLDRGDEMKKIQDLFLSRFPEHPLGADMYFASAMNALAAFDYQEAARMLEVIEYRYPNSKLAPKVKEIQERLKKMSEQHEEN